MTVDRRQTARVMSSDDSPQELLRWIFHHADRQQVAKGSGVSVKTLNRWSEGDFPTRRASSSVDAVDAWARKHFGPSYPPRQFTATLGEMCRRGARDPAPQESSAAHPDPAPAAAPSSAGASPPRVNGVDKVHGPRPRGTRMAVVVTGTVVLLAGFGLTISAFNGGTSSSQDAVCHPALRHDYRFPDEYVGRVHARLITDASTTNLAIVSLTWGPWRWEDRVDIGASSQSDAEAGVLLNFTKQYSEPHRDATLTLRSSTPVCVIFGTGAPPSPTPSEPVDVDDWVRTNS